MDGAADLEKQLKIIKWLLVLIVTGMLITGTGLVVFLLSAFDLVEKSFAESSCQEENFRDKASNLIDEGKTQEAIKLASEQISTHPNDEDGYWYRGLAYYLQKQWQPAINDFNKTEELAPGWKEQYTEPYRAAAQSKMDKH